MPRSGIGLNELLDATLLAGTVGCTQCKQPTEATPLVRALIELSVAHSTKTGLAMNLPQANLATQAAPVRSRTAAAWPDARSANQPKNNATSHCAKSDAKRNTEQRLLRQTHYILLFVTANT